MGAQRREVGDGGGGGGRGTGVASGGGGGDFYEMFTTQSMQ